MQTTMPRRVSRRRWTLLWFVSVFTGLLLAVNSRAEEYDNPENRDYPAVSRQVTAPASRYTDRYYSPRKKSAPDRAGRSNSQNASAATRAGYYSPSGNRTRYDSYRDTNEYVRGYPPRGRSGVERVQYDVPVYNAGPPVGGGESTYGMGGCDAGGCNIGGCDAGGCDVGGSPEILLNNPYAPGQPYLDSGTSCPCYASTGGIFWVRAEYLLWWLKGSQAPPLATTSEPADLGILGRDSTVVLFGDKKLNGDVRSGGRFDVGFWFDRDHILGLEGYYFFLGPSASHIELASEGDPLLARPYLDAENWQQASRLVAYPEYLQGTLGVRAVNGFQGFGALLRIASFERNEGRFYFLAGYRYLHLNDELLVGEYSEYAGPGNTAIGDRFRTLNEFNGADLGMGVHYHADRWSLELLMKVAFGDSQSIVDISGTTTTTIRGVGETTPQGLLALSTNSGHSVHHNFAMIPELGITVGFDITSCLRATAGYSIIYWSKVARAAGQIDTELNLSQLPPGPLTGAPRPQFILHDEDFWAQGANFGLELRF